MSACDCIKKMDEAMKQHNMGVVVNMIGPPRAIVETYVLKPKRGFRKHVLQATFCPFCGVKYPKEPTFAKRVTIFDEMIANPPFNPTEHEQTK